MTTTYVSRHARRFPWSSFPWGTLAVNLTGAFLLGLLTGLAFSRGAVSPVVKTVLGAGFLGAFTTFSTWQNELFRAFSQGSRGRPESRTAAWANLLLSTGLGLLAAQVGLVVGWRL